MGAIQRRFFLVVIALVLFQQIQERSEGQWKPSPGSVYPTIAQLRGNPLDLLEEHKRDHSLYIAFAPLEA